jgi:hypothetical protein
MGLNISFNVLETMVSMLEYRKVWARWVPQMEYIVNLGWTIVPHPPHSPDLAPSDFHLFGPMKDGLYGQHFPSYDAIVRAVKQ